MKIVYRAENVVDANLVKDALDHAGVPAYVSGEFLIGGQVPPRDFLNVMVGEGDVERAAPIVERIAGSLAELRAGGDPDPLAVPAY